MKWVSQSGTLPAEEPQPGNPFEVAIECEDGGAFAYRQSREQAIRGADLKPACGALCNKSTCTQPGVAVYLQVKQRFHRLLERADLRSGPASLPQFCQDQTGSGNRPLP